MAQFDVHRLATGELVVDCQVDELATLPTRVVVPLLDPEYVPHLIKALHPVFAIDGAKHVMATHLISAVPRNELGDALQSFERHRYTIVNALDFLTTGV